MSDQHGPEFDEVTVVRVLDLHDPPGVLPASDLLAVDLDQGVGPDHRKRDGVTEILDLLLVVLVLVTEIRGQKSKKIIIPKIKIP